MIKHRLAILATACFFVPRVVSFAAPAEEASSAGAAAFIENTASHLIVVINGSDRGQDARRQLQAIVDGAVDADGIAQFCLGRFWRAATPQQQQEYLGLFHNVLMNSITGSIAGYKQVTVTVGRVQRRGNGSVVSSIVRRPGQAATNVDWIVDPTSGGLRIEDVVAEGASLRLTQRSDYTAFLQQHGGDVGVLLDAMHQRLARQ